MLGLFIKCKHRIADLCVQKEQTINKIDNDFEEVCYHFRCMKCGRVVVKKHARLINGVDGFLREM